MLVHPCKLFGEAARLPFVVKRPGVGVGEGHVGHRAGGVPVNEGINKVTGCSAVAAHPALPSDGESEWISSVLKLRETGVDRKRECTLIGEVKRKRNTAVDSLLGFPLFQRPHARYLLAALRPSNK